MDWASLKLIEISFTTYCNANCPLCARTDKTTGKKKDSVPLWHYDIVKFKNLVDQLDGTAVNGVSFCGDYGDPMMHPHIEEAMEVKWSRSIPTVECRITHGTKRSQKNTMDICT